MSVARINPDLVDAFCTACKTDVLVGPSLACPGCGKEVDHASLAVMPKRVPAEPQKPAQRAAVLPRIRASVQLDGALDAVIVALEVEERAAKERYRLARQALADARQLRGLVKVAGEPVGTASKPNAASSTGKRWARDYDACTNCGTTDSPHQGKGECGRCSTYRRTNGHARPRTLNGSAS